MNTLQRFIHLSLYGTLLALCLCASLAFAADNLVVNPGFEQPAVSRPLQGWTFVGNGQISSGAHSKPRIGIAGCSRPPLSCRQRSGRMSAGPSMCMSRMTAHCRIPSPSRYRAPEQDCQVALAYSALEEGKLLAKAHIAFMLPASRDWRQFTADLQPPAGTRDILLELRADKVGTYLFDDVSLERNALPANGIQTLCSLSACAATSCPPSGRSRWRRPGSRGRTSSNGSS